MPIFNLWLTRRPGLSELLTLKPRRRDSSQNREKDSHRYMIADVRVSRQDR